jgi:DNA-binding transcriptional regulator YiaG
MLWAGGMLTSTPRRALTRTERTILSELSRTSQLLAEAAYQLSGMPAPVWARALPVSVEACTDWERVILKPTCPDDADEPRRAV